MPKLLGEVIDFLVAEGFDDATPDKVHFAISRRHVDKPPKDSAGRFVFGKQHIQALRQYFQARQARRARKKHTEPANA